MTQQELLAGAKQIAGWLGKSERWLRDRLKEASPLGRHIRRDEHGNLYAFTHELTEYVENLPRVVQ